MCADQEKVQKAGFTFIAIGGNTFQAGYTLPCAARRGRRPRHLQPLLRRPTPDKTVFDEQGLRDAIEMFRKIASQADAGWVNRAWNDTTNTVIAGKALMQIHGDWMKGQWRANGKKARRRLRLHQHPRHQGAVGDGRLLRHPRRRRRRHAQGRGGLRHPSSSIPRSMPSSPTIKGSSPVRLDVPTDKLDACNKLVLDSLKKPGFSVENPFYIGDPDWINSVWNTMYTFQGDPNMTTDDVIEDFRSEYAAVFP